MTAGRDEFVPDVMVYATTDDLVRVTGTPVLCVEVLSSDRAADTVAKSMKHAAQGVNHYWIVDLEREAVDVLVLADGIYRFTCTASLNQRVEVDFGAGAGAARLRPTSRRCSREPRPSSSDGEDRMTSSPWSLSTFTAI